MKIQREYEFPNAVIKAFDDGKYREFPKWCPHISVERSRQWVADALRELREFKRKQVKP